MDAVVVIEVIDGDASALKRCEEIVCQYSNVQMTRRPTYTDDETKLISEDAQMKIACVEFKRMMIIIIVVEMILQQFLP